MNRIELKEKLKDPFYFFDKVLGISNLTPDQNKVVQSVRDNKYTAAQSAHAVGKTFVAAGLFHWFVTTNKDSIVVTTAPTGRQVKELLWREINDLYAKAKYDLGGSMLTQSFNISEKWYGIGISPQPGKEMESAVTMQGFHAPKIFVILDEADGIHNSIWEAVDGITNSEGSKVLGIGNPQNITSQFHKKIISKEYNPIKISALTHPNVLENKTVIPGAVSYSWVKDKIKKWCEQTKEHDPQLKTFEFEGSLYIPNILFLWKVLGEYPEGITDTLISLTKIQNAFNREINYKTENRNGAVDPARFGKDSTSFCFDINGKYIFEKFYHFDIARLTGKAFELINKHEIKKFGVDCDGLGAGLKDNLQELVDQGKLDVELYEIHGGSEPLKLDQTEQFLNLRAQMYWLLKDDIDLMQLSYSEELEAGLSTIRYYFNRTGKIQIESKDEIKKRLQRSPDEEDSLAYCNLMKYVEPEYGLRWL